MTDLPESLVELARRYGVATEYDDWTGRHVTVAESTLVGVLDALGVPAATEYRRAAALAEHDHDHWSRSLPPVIVGRFGATSSFWVHVTHGDPVRLWIRLEDGSRPDRSASTGKQQGPLRSRRPTRRRGQLRTARRPAAGVPRTAPATGLVRRQFTHRGLPRVSGRRRRARTWGLATQLYSVRSQRSWGIGDLTDLTELAVWSAARHGAGFILVNPLHAAAPTAPMEPSPYLPTSRRFVNPMYLRVEAIPEFAYVGHRGRIRKAREYAQARAKKSRLIDRDAVWKVKRAALEAVYLVKRSAGRDLAYAAYPRAAGPQPRRLRDLVCAGREARRRLA